MRRVAALARGGTAAAVSVAIASLAACSGDDDATVSPTASAVADVAPAAAGPPADVALLPERSDATPPLRLAEGLLAPTNRWYSSLALGDGGLPVFPTPLSVRPVDGGFTLGLTRPTATANAILAPARDDIEVRIDAAQGLGVVTRADPVGATLSWGDAALTIAQGWPVAGITADAPTTVHLSVAFAETGDGVWTADVDGTTYGLAVAQGSVEGADAELDTGGSLQLFVVPDGGDAITFAAALGPSPATTSWDFLVTAEAAVTTVEYGGPTVVTVPQERAHAAGLDCDLGTYATIDGPFAVCAAAGVTWPVPLVTPTAALDLSGLTDDERAAVREALVTDATSAPPPPADTYFGSKALHRLAVLLGLADQLGEPEIADSLAATLASELEAWGDPDRCAHEAARCFTYDPVMGGVVGHTPSFGSEEFNDHHFHYGYLLSAAAVAGERDPELAQRIGPVMDLVAADIASAGDASLPPVRTFDPVAGHSWASGISPFADGNNQESSSEAVAAWNAVALWARVRGDDALEARATWMLSAEADAAARLWLAPDLTPFPEYQHSIVALEWGAKRDHATWFSPEPSAMLGIQIIPGGAVAMQTLGAIPDARIVSAVDAAMPAGPDVMFGDYLLMYQALAGDAARDAAWEQALVLPQDVIDDGSSRAHLLAWIASVPDD